MRSLLSGLGASPSQADDERRETAALISDAAALLASNPQIPEDPQMVRLLADLWVDYVLLATAVADAERAREASEQASREDAAAEPLKVAFMNVGPKTDGGWTEGHWHGAELMMKENK